MSRTYRMRHAPMYSGGRSRWRESHARKILDGGGGRRSWKERDQIIKEETIRLFGPRPEISSRYVRAKGLTHTEYTPTTYGTYKVRDDVSGKWMDCRYVRSLSKKKIVPGRWLKTREAYEWDRLSELVGSEYVWPTSDWHPWMCRPRVGADTKKWYRVSANRMWRHATRQILRSKIIDDDWDDNFPNKREFFDWWALY